MPQAPQTLRNHTRLYPPYHFFVVPVLLINVLVAIVAAYQSSSPASFWAVVVALALATFSIVARNMTLRVQDRVIRLEMRLRLRDALPPDLRARIGDLTPGHLIALRFASDDELPMLVREILAGTLATQKAIKERVKNWQGDYLRA
jgi:hypothetical protein